MASLFTLRLLQKYDVQCFHCPNCGYVRTERPYWLSEAYADAIAVTDTGVMVRNVITAAKLTCALFFCLDPRGAHLDVAGGYGILTRLMRDYGFDYYWEDKYCQNLVARGFEAANAGAPFTTMSAFEVLEHTEDPVAFVTELMERHRCRTLFFSTETYIGKDGPSPDWWYLSASTGQHISFFQDRTLRHMASRLGLKFYSYGGLHCFTDQQFRNRWLLPGLNAVSGMVSKIVRRRLGSRTWEDHLEISQRCNATVVPPAVVDAC
jgi:hypothetical protein